MTKDEELSQLRRDNRILYEALLRTETKLDQAQQANEDLREGLKQALIAMGSQQERIQALEEVITAQQERISTLARQSVRSARSASRSARATAGDRSAGQATLGYGTSGQRKTVPGLFPPDVGLLPVGTGPARISRLKPVSQRIRKGCYLEGKRCGASASVGGSLSTS